MVIGGYVSGDHPYFTQMWAKKEDDGRRISYEFCGGALIDREWVLTAGHCLKDYTPDDMTLRIGHNHPIIPKFMEDSMDGEISVDVCGVYKHPGYVRGAVHILPVNQICAAWFSMIGYFFAYYFSKYLKRIHEDLKFFIIPIFAFIGFICAKDITSLFFFNDPTYNDVGLIKLCAPVPKEYPIIPIDPNFIAPHSKVLIMGFGSESGEPIEILHEGKNEVISNKKCSANFYFGGYNWIGDGSICFRPVKNKKSGLNLGDLNHPIYVEENLLYLEKEKEKQKIEKFTIACKGDSGSPALMSLSGNGENMSLIGISSWGSRPCDQHPSVYTRISHYLPWVYGIISGVDDQISQ